MGPDVQLISSGDETAREVSGLLYHNNLLFTDQRKPTHRFFTTGDKDQFKTLADKWLEIDIEVESIRLGRQETV
jgi:glutamate racemase